ncbi:STAS domain-containing protein [Pseudanabaena sp. PCC 6802]|uniref:STAS domain-containing protein n=1 Tax=Pseudanabaena sp. PCC 6802 TaxID=118173 RepID=UPI000349F02F|nr:STAS domain-containing protein [Pseudanabaena sp. PCC 6802]
MSFELKIRDAITPQGQRLAIVPIAGRLDSIVTMDVRNKIQQIVDFGYPNLLLNLGQVTSFDSSGIGVLVSTMRKCKAAGGYMAICRSPDVVTIALEACGMEPLFPSFDDEETAIANFPA